MRPPSSLIRSWAVDAVELRRAGGQRYPDVSDYWKRRVPELVREYRLPVAAISPGLFKIDWPTEPAPLHFHRSGDMEQFDAKPGPAACSIITLKPFCRPVSRRQTS